MKRKSSILSKHEVATWDLAWNNEPVFNYDCWVSVRKKLCRRVEDRSERQLSVSEEHKPFVRGKRSLPNLPNNYDDYFYRKIGSRCWKDMHRCQHQWQKAV